MEIFTCKENVRYANESPSKLSKCFYDPDKKRFCMFDMFILTPLVRHNHNKNSNQVGFRTSLNVSHRDV